MCVIKVIREHRNAKTREGLVPKDFTARRGTDTQQKATEDRKRAGDGGWEGCFHGDQGERRERGSWLATVVVKVNNCR